MGEPQKSPPAGHQEEYSFKALLHWPYFFSPRSNLHVYLYIFYVQIYLLFCFVFSNTALSHFKTFYYIFLLKYCIPVTYAQFGFMSTLDGSPLVISALGPPILSTQPCVSTIWIIINWKIYLQLIVSVVVQKQSDLSPRQQNMYSSQPK